MTETLYQNCKIVQHGEAAIFYQMRKDIEETPVVFIAGVHIAPNLRAKVQFMILWRNFLNNVVLDNNMYCSLFLDGITDIFRGHMEYATELNGLSVFKIDNYIKEKYAKYA